MGPATDKLINKAEAAKPKSITMSPAQTKLEGAWDRGVEVNFDLSEETQAMTRADYDSRINARTLNEDQKTALHDYAYTDQVYSMNEALRAGKTLTGADAKMHDGLAGALASTTLTKDTVAFRGVGGSGILDGIQEGDVISDPAFTSVSFSQLTSLWFLARNGGKPKNKMLHITLPSGTQIGQPSPEEYEMLLAPGTKMKVVGIDDKYVKVVVVP